MKRFLEGVVKWKTAACFMFTGSMILYLLLTLILGGESLSVMTVVSLLILSAVGTFLQFLSFSDYLIKKIRYGGRLILFIVPFFALLTLCAYVFNWFPMESLLSWFTFLGIFLIVFVGMTVGFEIYYRITGNKYDGLLGQYRAKRDEKRDLVEKP